jgi:hypothetical protein
MMPAFTPPRSTPLDTPVRPRRGRLISIGAAAALLLTGIVAAPAQANHPEVSLPGSEFEIDTDANLVRNDPLPSMDWLSVADVPKPDLPSGNNDDSFGQGTKEDTPVPTVVSGSIPPNKSDLLTFSTYLETNANGKFLHMFWHRVQEPSGTTNMDFEFNQSSTGSGNGTTPQRTKGDLLIQYDLSQGGTNPQLFLSKWRTAAADGACEASNSYPCWGARANLTSAGDATGSINTTSITAANSGGLGSISPRTFGEATVDFGAIAGTGTCVSFGSAYLKSRSSDSFTAALKDFIAPAPTNLTNCASVTIRKQTDPDESTNATSFGFAKAFATSPATANSFNLTDDGVQSFTGVFFGNGLTVSENEPPAGWDLSNIDCSASANVTPTVNLLTRTVTFNLTNSDQTVDCTFTNRARGTIVVEKITDDGTGSFDFTSNTLSPSPFTLTTTAVKGARTFSNLSPNTYDVAETVPANWNLASKSCSDGSDPSAIGLSAGETVTCTFHDTREVGAIKIVKTRKHAAAGTGDHPHAGVEFVVTGGGIAAPGLKVTSDANGVACVSGLIVSALVGNYTVTETVPAGYHLDGANGKTATVVESEGDCDPITPGATVAFRNTPLTNITVSVDSQIPGGTASTIDCDPAADPPFDFTTPAGGDGSFSLNDKVPGTYVCTIVVDP